LIRPDGHIDGLDLHAGGLLIVRDYDGDPRATDHNGNPANPLAPIPISVDQHLTIGPGGMLRMVFEADAWDSTISFAPGIPVALGGTLELTFSDDVNLATQVGRTFDLFDWTGVNPTGLFNVAGPHIWDLSQLYTTGDVTLAAVGPLPGDYNGNGIVDAADYIVWRANLGGAALLNRSPHLAGPVGPADYAFWNANFGNTLAGTAQAAVLSIEAIPEPTTLLLLSIGLAALLTIRAVAGLRTEPPDRPQVAGPPGTGDVRSKFVRGRRPAHNRFNSNEESHAEAQRTQREMTDVNSSAPQRLCVNLFSIVRCATRLCAGLLTPHRSSTAGLLVSPSTALLLCCATALFSSPSPAHADIFQWEYTNAADPSQGKRQSTTLAPEGAGVDAVPGANLTWRNLTMAYLIGEDLVDARMESTNLTNADLSQANLTNAGLSYSDFTNARLNQANLTNAQANYVDFTGGDLSQANLNGARFDNAKLSGATFTGAEIQGASFNKDGGTGVTPAQLYSTASYQAHDLTGIGVNGNNLAGGNFASQNLSSASFVYASMTGADFRQANLDDANFYDATLTDADFTGAEVRGANFDKYNGTGITLAQLYSTASYQAHDLGGISLSRNDLIGSNFAGQNLTNANFGEANLSGANLRQANLTNATIWSVTLTGVDFTGAEVRGASFYRDPTNRNSEISLAQLYSTSSYQAHDLTGIGLDLSDLTGANFAGQNLTNARIGGTLTGADFTNADIRAATISPYYDSNTSMYVGGITPAQLYTTASYKAHDLSGINLYGHNLTAGNFASQNLTKANLSGVLTGASFRHANLTDAAINGTLTDADFTDAEVRGATLGGISSAQLYSTASYQAYDLAGIRLHGDLSGWNFAGQNLTKAHFDSATLTGADLSETTLTNATFTYAKLTDADLTRAEVHGASFAAANLTRASLRHVNLANVNLTGATLTDADFTGADVGGASFDPYFAQCARSCYGAIWGTGITLPQLYSTASYQAQDLSGIRLPWNYLSGANFAGQNLTNADFTYTTLTGADITGAEVRGATFAARDSYTRGGITLAQLYSTASYQARDLTGIRLQGNQLSGGNFAGQNLTNADFSGATLADADFRRTNLTNASFSSAKLTLANFTDADVRGASFFDAGITLAQLYSTASYQAHDLRRINLLLNNLAGGNFAGQNLTSANFSFATLTGADFSGADLSDTHFGNANLTGANFRQANLDNASFAYPSCFSPGNLNGIGGGAGAPGGCGYFSYATLTDADLTAADARGAFGLKASDATTINLIRPDGHVTGLDLDAGALLVVRDYDGNSNNDDVYGNPIPNPMPLPPISITVEQHLTMGAGGTLRMVFEADAWDSTISFAPGIPVTLGGTLELTFAAGVNLASQVGRTLKIFDWTGVNPTGAFDISSPYAWGLSNLYTTGQVTLIVIPEPASFVLTTVLAAHLVLPRHRRLRCARSKSKSCWAHAVHDVFIEVLINEKGDHGINPFARARSKSSSLVGPTGCDASIVLRIAVPRSSHWRRYSSKGSGLARYRLITAYTSANRSERYERAIPSGDSPCLKALITSSSRTRLSPTRKTPGGSSDRGTFRLSGLKSTALTVPILPSSLSARPPLDVLADASQAPRQFYHSRTATPRRRHPHRRARPASFLLVAAGAFHRTFYQRRKLT
jgi:uncharacterized protein YjbI with pentapeptide repeats